VEADEGDDDLENDEDWEAAPEEEVVTPVVVVAE